MTELIRRPFEIFFDILDAIGAWVGIIVGLPFRVLKRTDRIFILLDAIRYLLPHRMLGLLCRSIAEERAGNYAQASLAVNHIVTEMEKRWDVEKLSTGQLQLMVRLFTRLLRLQILAGRIDDGTQTVIRANAILGVAYLPDFQGFDVKIAHIVII